MPSTTFRQMTLAVGLFSMPMLALSAPVDLTCKWTDIKNPRRTETLTMTVDSALSTVAISRGTARSIVFSAAEIRFTATNANGWDWKYVLNRTTLVLTETNHTGSGQPADFACILVDRKV